jgi:hypothetical protein
MVSMIPSARPGVMPGIPWAKSRLGFILVAPSRTQVRSGARRRVRERWLSLLLGEIVLRLRKS